MLIVQKYGGSSLADRDRLRHVAQLCLHRRQEGQELVVVVSAMGDTTDILTDKARQVSVRPAPRELDALMTTGEQQAAALLVMAMQELGMKAVSLTGWQAGILTDSSFGGGDIRLIAPSRIREELSMGRIPVVTGFQGICPHGDITSLGRGGSDTTAVALAAALEADRCEIYTDVDGIYTADPRRVADAVRLDAIDLRDMLALAKGGSQVLHERSVALAMAGGVELRLLSSFSEGEGTAVKLLREPKRPVFAGVTGNAERGTVCLAGRGADAAVLSALVLCLAGEGIPVLSGAMDDNSVTVSVSPAQQCKALETVHRRFILDRK